MGSNIGSVVYNYDVNFATVLLRISLLYKKEKEKKAMESTDLIIFCKDSERNTMTENIKSIVSTC